MTFVIELTFDVLTATTTYYGDSLHQHQRISASAVIQKAFGAGEDALPPDTFRKLAQALYQRGDKAENRMHRKFFYNTNITCNDGSSAGYYIRRNYQSKRWIVFLEGENVNLACGAK